MRGGGIDHTYTHTHTHTCKATALHLHPNVPNVPPPFTCMHSPSRVLQPNMPPPLHLHAQPPTFHESCFPSSTCPTLSSLLCSVDHMRSSVLPRTSRYWMLTLLTWPMRCTRSSACRGERGGQNLATMPGGGGAESSHNAGGGGGCRI